MQTFLSLQQSIMNDPDNLIFTKQHWVPIFMANPKAKILIIGQAPGLKTQLKEGVFHDQSGDRLRTWLGVDADTFYNSGNFAVLPMDFYFPGHGKSGDLPPRKDFADKWHPQCLKLMPDIQLTILIGSYAQKKYLPNASSKITENVLNFSTALPQFFPLIHPSPRNQMWIAKHPEFDTVILPQLRKRVSTILQAKD